MRGPAPANNLARLCLRAQSCQDDRAADHEPPKTHGTLPVLDQYRKGIIAEIGRSIGIVALIGKHVD